LCCEIFVTKSKLKVSLAVWRNLLPYIFQGGLQPGSPSRRAAPAQILRLVFKYYFFRNTYSGKKQTPSSLSSKGLYMVRLFKSKIFY